MTFSLLGDTNTQRPSHGPGVDTARTLANPTEHPTITVRAYHPRDAADICSWVRSRSAIRLVSGDDAERLTPELLKRWLTGIVGALVAVDSKTDGALGFCTLTRREVLGLPEGTVELCHLIVAPEATYFFIGSRLCRATLKCGGELGYNRVVARIVPTNRWALALARRIRSKEVHHTPCWADSSFRWFELPTEIPNQGSI